MRQQKKVAQLRTILKKKTKPDRKIGFPINQRPNVVLNVSQFSPDQVFYVFFPHIAAAVAT